MTFRTLMQAGPAKANDLFASLAETSDGAVKTREKLFAELKSELELHASLEEQHLFPILKRNAETKGLVADAIKDNKELRAQLVELDGIAKNDEAFLDRLKQLQKIFRQHARDEKRELLPAVKRALSEEQVQGVAEKMEAGVAEAEQARHDELEGRRAKAREQREEAERQEKLAAARQARHEETERNRAKAREENVVHEREEKLVQAAKQAQDESAQQLRHAGEAAMETGKAMRTSALRVVEDVADGAQRAGAGLQEKALQAAKAMVPTAAILPGSAMNVTKEMRSMWMDWFGEATRAGTQMSQRLVQQSMQQNQRFAAGVVQGVMAHNARVMQITMQMAQSSFRPFANRKAR